jgi:predicted PurR-regulated permease PerM
VETNIITPLVLVRRLTLNPLLMFLWLSLWFGLWGFAGALLAVPVLKTLKIFCDNNPPLARGAVSRALAAAMPRPSPSTPVRP